MPQPPHPFAPSSGTTIDWLANKALQGLIRGALALPYETRVPFMGRVLRQAIGPLSGYRKRAFDNLTMIYPNMTQTQRAKIAGAVCDNFGRTLIENYSWQDLGARLAKTRISGFGMPHLLAARARNQPVIFVTGHFGNHEAPRHALTAQGCVIGGLYRPMRNPYVNAHYKSTMTSWGGPVFEQGRRGTAGFARHLKDGGMATLLFDVASAAGTALPFLGQPAMTSTSAADLALRFDALVLPYFGVRQDNGLDFDVFLETPIPHDDPLVMMTAMTQRLEERIASAPEQWFWVHRRWKNAPPLTDQKDLADS